PQIEARFLTSQSYSIQVGIAVIGLGLGQLVVAAIFALIAGWCVGELPATRARAPLGAALRLGCLAAGVMAALSRLSPAADPLTGDVAGAQGLAPWADAALDSGVAQLTRAAGLFAVIMLARGVGRDGARQWWATAFLFVAGGLVALPPGASSVGSWWALVAV